MKTIKSPNTRLVALLAGAVVTASLATAGVSSIAAAAPARSAAIAAPPTSRTLLASDEFTGPAGSSPNPYVWTALQGGGGWGNHELQSYTARRSNVSLNGSGDLSITARKETYTGADGITSQYTSARLISQASMLYGYAEARMYLPAGQGLWPAFWTIGADVYQGVPWPVTGEIDIMEAYNQMNSVWGTIHGPTTGGTAFGLPYKYTPSYNLSGSWHTYGVDWTANSMTWYLDGVAYHTLHKADLPANEIWEFNKPQRLQLNLAIGGDGPGQTPGQEFPATLLVDYVRVYTT
jgi:beta-glucanase (GH16 family)